MSIAASTFAPGLPRAACAGLRRRSRRLPPERGRRAQPAAAAAGQDLIPTVNIAPAAGLAAGRAARRRRPASRVTALARGLDHPRWVYVLPNGDVLVAESNKPPKPPKPASPRASRRWVMKLVMKRAGAGVPSANRITLAARRRRRRRGRDAQRVPAEPDTRPSAWRWWATSCSSPTPMRVVQGALPAGPDPDHAPRRSR